jgi:DNA invertase Pin-like site-specific DNA recombinase
MEGTPEGEAMAQGSVCRECVTKPPNKLRRYAIYTRQSVDTTADFSSCDAQFAVCCDFAKETAEPGLSWCGQRFDDRGYSGATLERPALRRLREAIDLGGIDRLYAVALDRLSRRLKDTIVLLDELEHAGVELRLVHQPELGQEAESRFLRHILASFAQFERELIADRIAETRSYLKKRGRRLAGPVPFGYDGDPDTKQLVPNRIEARRVRAVFKRAAAGQTPAEIARRINHLGWRTKQWVSRRSGKEIGGGRWTARRVLALLRNPVYIGRFADTESTRPGCHVAIVQPETFQVVQNLLDQRRSARRGGVRHQHRFSLRGKIICPKCRRPLATFVVHQRRGRVGGIVYRYYRCRSMAGGRSPCRGVQYPAGEVERFVHDLLGQPETWRQVIDRGSSFSQNEAEALRAVWRGLDILSRERQLPQIVDRVEFRRLHSEMRITFNPRQVGVLTSSL